VFSLGVGGSWARTGKKRRHTQGYTASASDKRIDFLEQILRDMLDEQGHYAGLYRTGGYIGLYGWLGSRVVSVLDSGAEGPGFKSQPRRCRVTVLDKLFTPIVPLFTKQQNW